MRSVDQMNKSRMWSYKNENMRAELHFSSVASRTLNEEILEHKPITLHDFHSHKFHI